MKPDGKPALKPRLRFPEFRNAVKWEDKSLISVAILENGYAFKSSEYVESGKYRIITIGNVQSGWLNLEKTKTIPTLPVDIQPHQKLEPGDILISMTGNVGRVCRVNATKCLLNQRVGKIVPHAIDNEFLYHLIQNEKFQNAMQLKAAGGAQGNLSACDIEEYILCRPLALAEQRKVADCLASLDEVIAAQGGKLAWLKALKKGLMQQLFPRAGQTRPRLRFPEFRDKPEWEEDQLQNIAQINPRRDQLADETLVSFVPMSAVSEDGYLAGHQVRAFAEVKKGFTFFRDRDVIIAKITPCFENGKAALLDGLENGVGLGSTEFHVIRANAGCLPEFLFAYLYTDELRRLGKSAMTGSAGQQRVPAVFFEEYPIALPKISEQRRITDCLSFMDALIAAQTQKIDALQTHKKGLMQQLFPCAGEA